MNTKAQANASPPAQPAGRRFMGWPTTRLGWWSVGLMVTFVVLMIINGTVFMRLPGQVSQWQALLPFYGIGMMACGLAAGVVALIALARGGERSWLVWLPCLAGLFVIVFVLGEFLFPH